MHIFMQKLVPKPNYSPLLLAYPPTWIITYGQMKTIQYNKPWVFGLEAKRGGQQGKYELLILTFIQ
jgi:hypothetical protein